MMVIQKPRRPNSNSSSHPRLSSVQGTNHATVGVILLDSSLKPVYCNPEALRIFAYPDQPPQSPGAQFLESIHLIVGKNHGPNGSVTKTTHFMSGKRRYLCRTIFLETELNGNGKPTIALIVERERSVLSDLATRFKLSEREIEAVQHLADGLTSKEMGRRRNHS